LFENVIDGFFTESWQNKEPPFKWSAFWLLTHVWFTFLVMKNQRKLNSRHFIGECYSFILSWAEPRYSQFIYFCPFLFHFLSSHLITVCWTNRFRNYKFKKSSLLRFFFIFASMFFMMLNFKSSLLRCLYFCFNFVMLWNGLLCLDVLLMSNFKSCIITHKETAQQRKWTRICFLKYKVSW